MDNINFVDDLPSMKLKANINNTVQLKTWGKFGDNQSIYKTTSANLCSTLISMQKYKICQFFPPNMFWVPIC